MLSDNSCKRKNLYHLLLAVLIGVLFLLPHAVRMAALRSIRDYSPFSDRSPDPTVVDETFLYGPEINYTYRQHRLAGDTDAFEHRGQPMPYSVLPAEAEVLLAEVFRSVVAAQIFCYFLFPAISAWLLMALFLELDASLLLAALLALITLVASFSMRTFLIGITHLLRQGLHSGFIETLQASRNPNPNMTFPLFLAALLAQIAALRKQSIPYALLAGALGGLLFYSYIYYAVAWAASATLIVLIALLRSRRAIRLSLATWLATICVAVPFLLWVRAAKKTGGYFNRSDRLGMVHSHLPTMHDLKLSVALAVCLVLLWTVCRYFASNLRSPENKEPHFARIAAMVFGCAAAGGILGMNMQVLTGVNVQASHHFPHMVIQPALVLLSLILLLAATGKVRRQHSARLAGAVFVALFAACVASQVEAGVNSAPLHRIAPWQQVLFRWLNRNTHPGDVVATTSLRLALSLPLYSQDCTLMVDGSRTVASDREILDRYLLAEALTGAPASTIAKDLGRQPKPSDEPWTSYPPFFYEFSPYLASPAKLKPAVVEDLLAKYRVLDPAEQLKHFRVDYLYTENGQEPAKIAGIDWRRVLVTTNGSLWRLNKEQVAPSR
jgi:hypothetical protein